MSLLRGGHMYDQAWLSLYPTPPEIAPGSVGCVVAHRFAIGILPGHVERGEERFGVERLDDKSVWLDILAF